ncbi:MAG TPA: phosphoglucosamine mutase [Candidatus Sulfotelmatobacter sp.]|nr:phosphoglucosamine mutase [Candidatus Sulfotelmatobacter sp.]
MPLKISISGVRGTVPDSLTPEVCLDLAKAFGTYLGKGTVVIGADPRRSSEFIKGIVFSGLLSTGIKVVDIGIAPTPTVGIMVRELAAAGGIVITASHNPLPWNGLKFMRGDGVFLNEEQATKFLKLYEGKVFKQAPTKTKGVKIVNTALDKHIARVLKAVNPLAIRLKKFRVAVDGCNGAGSVALPRLLARLGCKVFTVNCDTRLPFPHDPEPVPANLGELAELVKEKKADLGLAVDSDADRLAVVSEEGIPIGEELTLALVVKFLLGRRFPISTKKRIVVSNLSTTKALDDLAREYGALSIRTKVGEVNVVEQIKSLKALVGGEGNGGVIYPKVGLNRDSLAGAALLLNYLAAAGKKLSRLAAGLPHYEMIKTKLECASQDEANDVIEKAKRNFKGNDLVLTEGVKVLLPDAWVHIRASNTEPIIRIIAEARTKAQAEELIRRITA